MLVLLVSYTQLFCLTALKHPSATVWALLRSISAPYASIYIHCHFEAGTSQNPCLQGKNQFKPIPDAEELSLEGSFMAYFPAQQCEDICPPLPVLIPTS